MPARMQSPENPDVITAIQHLTKAVLVGGVDPLVLELVHLRASQLNGCSPCVFAGVAAAKNWEKPRSGCTTWSPGARGPSSPTRSGQRWR